MRRLDLARHARAGSVELSLEQESGVVTLRVCDDERGLPPDSRASTTGIRGMRERAMLIGAEPAIQSPEMGGTEIILRVPLEER